MSSAVQPYDGIAVTEFELVMPQHAPKKFSFKNVTYLGSSLIESIFRPAVYTHRFATTDQEMVDRALRQVLSVPTPRLRFRVGCANAQTTFWLPWQDHLLTAHSFSPQSSGDTSGHILHIQTMDKSFEIDRSGSVAAHRGKISDIVKAIAKANGVNDCVIEPTVNTGVYIQNFIGDMQFIRERLISRAVNARGLANYFCFFRDNVLHFHTADYQATVRNVSYANLPSGDLAVTDNTQKLFPQGIAGVRMTVYDPYTGQGKEVTSNPAKSLRYANALYPAAGVKGAELDVFYHLSTNQPEETTAIAQCVYDNARFSAFQLQPKFEKLINIRVGDIANLTLSQRDSVTSPYSGYYLVSAATHEVNQGAISTMYTFQRGEIQKMLADTTSVSSNDQLKPELTAPGQDLNIQEIKASQLTKGAGKQASEKAYTTLSDANKGPS